MALRAAQPDPDGERQSGSGGTVSGGVGASGVGAGGTVSGVRVAPEGDTGSVAVPVDGGEEFESGELAVVCSRFPLGVIRSARVYRRGSRRSPKMVLDAEGGSVLIKRRAPRGGGRERVVFSHAVQSMLAEHGFPVARLVPMHGGGTALFLDGRTYEIFEYVAGKRFDRSAPASAAAGGVLGRMHVILAGFDRSLATEAPTTCFHAIEGLGGKLERLSDQLSDASVVEVGRELATRYERARTRADELGFASWPRQVIHADWHPGNLVYRDREVIAVLDFDTARFVPRAIDVANGALQFSATRTGLDPLAWPVDLDRERLSAFLHAYDRVEGCVLSKAELRALPWLMIEGLIAEATVPVLTTGRFGVLPAREILPLVTRRAEWIESHADEIAGVLGGTP